MSSEVQKKRPRREVWPKRPSAGQTSGSLAIRKTVRGLCGDAVRIFMNNSRKHIYSMRCAVDPYLPTGPLSSLSRLLSHSHTRTHIAVRSRALCLSPQCLALF